MNWETIIIALGSSLITGMLSLLGNVLISRNSIKKMKKEIQENRQSEFMKQRILIYSNLTKYINSLESCLKNEELEKQNIALKSYWTENYPYCSMEINHKLRSITNFNNPFDENKTKLWRIHLKSALSQIKKEIDEYFGNKETDSLGHKNY